MEFHLPWVGIADVGLLQSEIFLIRHYRTPLPEPDRYSSSAILKD
jgi:hypothetical protein